MLIFYCYVKFLNTLYMKKKPSNWTVYATNFKKLNYVQMKEIQGVQGYFICVCVLKIKTKTRI